MNLVYRHALTKRSQFRKIPNNGRHWVATALTSRPSIKEARHENVGRPLGTLGMASVTDSSVDVVTGTAKSVHMM